MAAFSFSSSNISRGTCAFPERRQRSTGAPRVAARTCWCTTRRGAAARATSVPASAAPAAPDSAASAARRPTKRRGGGGCCGSALEGASIEQAGSAACLTLLAIESPLTQAIKRRERRAKCVKPVCDTRAPLGGALAQERTRLPLARPSCAISSVAQGRRCSLAASRRPCQSLSARCGAFAARTARLRAATRTRLAMAESEATTQFRELQKQYIEASGKLKQVRVRCRAPRCLRSRRARATGAGREPSRSYERPAGRAKAADARAARVRRWPCKAARANRSASAASSRWRSWTRCPRRATPTRAWAERACFGPARLRVHALTMAVCARSFVHQAKPELVKELRDAVANCDEELEKLKARALARTRVCVPCSP